MTTSRPTHQTLAEAASFWLEADDRPTAPRQGEVRTTADLHSLARRIAGADADPHRPLLLLCDGHTDECDLVLAALASGRPILLAPSTLRPPTLAQVRTSIRPAAVVAASEPEDHPEVPVAWTFDASERDPLRPGREEAAIGTLTSGSTGDPKAFYRSQGSQYDQAVERVAQWPVSIADDIYGHIGIASFAGSMNTICMGVATGLRIVVGLATEPDLREGVRRYGINFLSLTPTLLRHLCRNVPDGTGFEAIHTLHLSGEAVRPTDVGEFHRVSNGRTRLRVSWGSTEAGTLASGDLEASLAKTEGPLPVGHPMSNVEVVAIDEDGGRCPVEVTGRLMVRSPNLAVSGDRLAERFRILPPDEAPWFDTGDEGWIASDGRIVVRGREDGDLLVNSARIDGLFLENHLSRLDDVVEVVVVRLDLDGGQALGIAVVASSDRAFAAISEATAALGPIERRAVIEGFDALPLNASRKTDRHAVADAIRQRIEDRRVRQRDQGATLTATESLVADAWQASFDIARPDAETSLDDLGVDSVGRLRLMLELEQRHGLVLPPDARATSITVSAQARDLVPVTTDGNATEDPVVTLRPDGDSVACFCPGIGGHAWIFEPIARNLEHGVEAIGLDWSRAASRGRRGMAWLIDRLEHRVAGRRLSILGYSAGAGIAWSLASEWTRRHAVEVNVVALDGDPILRRQRRKLWRSRLQRLVGTIRGDDDREDAITTRLTMLREDGLKTLARCSARPATHPLTIVVTPESESVRTSRWRTYASDIRVEVVDRPHLELLRPPLDERLVGIVRDTMRPTV